MYRRSFLQAASAVAGSLLLGGWGSAQAGRPNILFCIADDASYPHMGAYGCAWVETPGFDRVARDGVLFNRAYTPNAKCAPSRACVLTGRNSWQLEEAANHMCYFPAKFRTYAEVLGEHGYHVGHTAKGWAPGDPGEVDGKRRELTGKAYNARKTAPPTDGISNIDYAGNFEDFLAERGAGQPFCFWYGGFEPHRRYEYGSGVAKGGKRPEQVDAVPAFWPDNETVRTDMLDYAYEVNYFDRHLERMLETLEARGELDNTLVVVTADNGMPFPRVKGQEYELSNHLPLAIMWKAGIPHPGRVVDDFVSFIDFTPTFLEAAACGMAPITGRSLMPLLVSEESGQIDPARDHVLIGKERHDVGRPNDVGYPIRGIVKGDYLYLRNFEPERWPAGNPETGYLNCDGSPTKTECIEARKADETKKYWQWSFGKRPEEELYRISTDRECMDNLAGNVDAQDIKEALRAQLFDELTAQGDPRMSGQGQIFDQYRYTDERTRNFHERYMRGEDVKAGWVNETDFEPSGGDGVYTTNSAS